jgi:hypothetical protein
MKSRLLAILAVSLLSGCADRPAGSDQIELDRARSGDLDVVLLSSDGALTHGKDSFTVEFRRGDNLVDVGTVKGAATMPMAGLPAMLGSVFVDPGDAPGRYTATTDLSMSGGWQLAVEWDGPAGKGRTSFDTVVE